MSARRVLARHQLLPLTLTVAAGLVCVGLWLSIVWFTNLGSVYVWHLAGPTLLAAGVALYARVLRVLDIEDARRRGWEP